MKGQSGESMEGVSMAAFHGGDATFVHLPEIGITGNTHFPMSDLNNATIGSLLSDWLRAKGLDKRGQGNT